MDADLQKLQLDTATAARIAKLRKTLLCASPAAGEDENSFPCLFTNLLTTAIDTFVRKTTDKCLEFAVLPETKRLQLLLEIHSQCCALDSDVAEELGRQGTHRQVLRLIQFDVGDDEVLSESNQDVIMNLQDCACSIAATYGGSFPMQVCPFALEELRQRLPLVFDISPFPISSKEKLQMHSILIHQVTRRQSAQEDVGFVMWPAAVVLVRWLAGNPELLSQATSVLEIGAGCGLVGLLAASMLKNEDNEDSPPTSVVLSDFNPLVLDNLMHNVLLNDVADRCTVVGLDFYQQEQQAPSDGEGWLDMNDQRHPQVDLVLAADMICQPSDAVAASQTLANALCPGGRAFIVCATATHRFGVDIFPDECQRHGLSIHCQNVSSLTNGALLGDGLEQTAGYVEGMELTMFTIEKPIQ